MAENIKICYVQTADKERIFPVTAAAGVFMPDGTTLDKNIEQLEQVAAQYDDKLSVLAHSGCSLEEQVAQLRTLLLGILSGEVLIPKLAVKELGVWGANNLIVTGEGVPTKAPDRAGQLYIDTKNNAVYHSVGNNAVSDWKP